MEVKNKINKKILVVEDEIAIRKITTTKLELAGLNVRAAINGDDAMKILKEVNPDVILLDLVMPKMDGFEFLEKLRDDPRFKDTPVIVFTNLGQESDKIRTKSFGVKDFLIKAETSLESLCDKVLNYCAV